MSIFLMDDPQTDIDLEHFNCETAMMSLTVQRKLPE